MPLGLAEYLWTAGKARAIVHPQDVLMIRKASQQGLGEMDLERLRIKSLSV